MYSIGVDLGGTTIKAGVVTSQGVVERSESRATTPDSPDQIIGLVAELVESLRGSHRDWPLGVAVAAFLDPSRRHVMLSPNINWENVPLAEQLEDMLGGSVAVENDANAAGWAEYQVGAARHADSSVMFTLGTGVGGSVIDRGQLLIGSRGLAGELGHLPVEFPGHRCGCGQSGCVETVASAKGFLRELREKMGEPGMVITDVEPAFLTHPAVATELFERAAEAMARAILQVHAVVDPGVVVLGGGIIERTGKTLVAMIQQRVAALAADRRSPLAEIVPAQCGNQAGIVGAALLARARLIAGR